MDLRSGAMPSDRPADPVGPTSWRVPTKLVVIKAGGTLAFAALALLSLDGERTRLTAAVAGAVLLGLWTLRDLLAPVRVSADEEGVTVVEGFARRRRLPWSHVERVRVDERDRLGIKSRMLEIDAGESLHLFSEYDLGTPVEEALARLDAIRVTDKKSHN
jgi:PH (Pleckstrin Homology) domain-containing protein